MYKSDLFKASTIERMMVHFQRLLTGITNDPQQPIAWLLNEAKRHLLME